MHKAITISVLVGIIVLVTTILIISYLSFQNESTEILKTPSDNYSEKDREKFCGTGDAKSTKYVKEFKIPTKCTQPQAIWIDPGGNVWFAQSNTGKLAKFDPLTESFTEFDNPLWPNTEPSMMSGIDYASDNSLWFTDDRYDSVWKFNIDTQEYHRFSFPSDGTSIPQKLKILGSQMIVNDLTGNKLAIFDLTTSDQNMSPFLIPSNNPNAVTSSFTLDDEKNIWYSTWELNSTGVIIKINQTSLENAMQNFTSSETKFDIDFFALPIGLSINGIEFDKNGNLWLADSSSSSFYKFKPISGNRNYTKYVTTDPSVQSYGNFSGNIKSPISRPNWMESNSLGNIVFNEPGANRIGIMNPVTETLIEYEIPSKNPFWADCGDEKNCGIAHILEFAIDGEKVWFTEWAENNIGYVDTGILLPVNIALDSTVISLKSGEIGTVKFTLTSNSQSKVLVHPISSNPNRAAGLEVQLDLTENTYFVNLETPIEIQATIFANENVMSGEYKILLGSSLEDVSISKFVTIKIE